MTGSEDERLRCVECAVELGEESAWWVTRCMATACRCLNHDVRRAYRRRWLPWYWRRWWWSIRNPADHF